MNITSTQVDPVPEVKKKHAGGRPTKLTPAMYDKAYEYLSTCCDDKEIEGKLTKVNLPSKVGLALYLEVDETTIDLWNKEDKEFSGIVSEILGKQKKVLVEKGLQGTYNASIAKLILTKHGYNDTIKQDTTLNGELSVSILSEAHKRAMDDDEEE